MQKSINRWEIRIGLTIDWRDANLFMIPIVIEKAMKQNPISRIIE